MKNSGPRKPSLRKFWESQLYSSFTDYITATMSLVIADILLRSSSWVENKPHHQTINLKLFQDGYFKCTSHQEKRGILKKDISFPFLLAASSPENNENFPAFQSFFQSALKRYIEDQSWCRENGHVFERKDFSKNNGSVVRFENFCLDFFTELSNDDGKSVKKTMDMIKKRVVYNDVLDVTIQVCRGNSYTDES